MPDDEVSRRLQRPVPHKHYPLRRNLVFAKTQPDAPAGQPPRSKDQVIVRMSLEHLKVMVMVLKKNLRGYEQRTGITVELPFDMLNSMGLSKEDW